MSSVICFASAKGGSGKTTITASFARFLSETQKRVLMIDCDEGTHGLTLMYLNEVNEHCKRSERRLGGTFDIENDAKPELLRASIVEVRPGLCLLPARHSFSDAMRGSIRESSDGALIPSIVEILREDFDYILLDAQAGISSASRAAMSQSASDTVILVSEYDPMSNAGVERLKASLPEELDVGRTWILLNKLLPEFVSKFTEFLTVAKYLPPVPWTADVVRAYSRRSLALDFENGNQFTLAILNALRELLVGVERENLEQWVNEQTDRLREPIVAQIEETQELLAELTRETVTGHTPLIAFTRALGRWMPMMFAVITFAMMLALGFSAIVGADGAQLKELVDRLSSGSLGFWFAVMATFVLFTTWEVVKKTMRFDVDRKREIEDERKSEIASLRRRLDDLRTLSGADYDDIVVKRSK